MIDLTDTAAVYARARKAYENRELQAQNPDRTVDYCSYKGPCALGVSMTEAERNIVEPHDDMSSAISFLIGGENKLVAGDIEALGELQAAHDRWSGFDDTEDSAEIAEAEADFVIQMWRY